MTLLLFCDVCFLCVCVFGCNKITIICDRCLLANMKEVCLCKICICGRHRCERPPTELYSKDSNACVVTEYNEKYPCYESYQPRKSHAPKLELKSSHGPMEKATTFRSDYIPYEVSPRPGKQQAEYKPKPGEIDLSTTYKQEFGPYKLEPVLPWYPKEGIRVPKGKVNTVPTYKEHFSQWEMSRRQSLKPKVSLHPSHEKFGNATTFQDHFIPQDLVPMKSFKPSNVPKISNVPFNGVTSYKVHYIPHPVDVHYVKAPHEYKPSDQPFQDFTTHQHYFRGLPGQMPKSCKPKHVALSCNTPFQGKTEFRDRFQPWPVFPLQLRKTSPYISPTEKMDMTTTTATTFIKHKMSPFIAAKSKSRPVHSTDPFQGDTTMKEHFKAWKSQRQEMIRKPPAIQKGSGKMEDTSTFKAHYIQHQLQPTVSCKPLTGPLRSEAPLAGETSYRTEFTPRKVVVCPASFQQIPGFVFEKIDDRGHKLFRKMNAKEPMLADCEV